MNLERLSQIEEYSIGVASMEEEKQIIALARWAIVNAKPALEQYKFACISTVIFPVANEALEAFPADRGKK